MNSQVPAVATPSGADYVDFVELWRTIQLEKWRIFGIVAVFLVLGTLYAFSADPVYRAGITLLIEPRPNRPVQVQEVYDPGFDTDEYLETQTALLKSRDMVGRVVDQLELTTNPDIVPPPDAAPLWNRFLAGRWLPFVPDDQENVAASPVMLREFAIDQVLARTKVAPIQRTQLRRVYFESRNSKLAADVANALGDMFISAGLDSRLETTERATRWLTQRLSDLRIRLEQSEKALQAYREQHQLVNVRGTRSLFEEDVVDNARKLRDAQSKKTELASTYWKIQQAKADDRKLQEVTALLLDPTVQRAGDNLLQARQAVKQLEERYGAKHPQMSAAQARLQGAEQSYHNQLRLAANGIKAEYEIAAETERALLEIVQSGKAQIRKLDQRDYEVRALEREVETNRELYDMLLKRYKETDTAASFEATSARFVDRAVVPMLPYRPNKQKVIALWTLGGLLVGLVLAALKHLLTGSIRSPEHLEQATHLPVISVLPPVSGLGKKSSAPDMVLQQPRAAFPEGVRSIRASLYLSDVDKRIKKVMFTSAVPREGKSSIASSFAVVLAQRERVVLVEADLRAPTLKKIFGIDASRPGLVELLTGQAKFEQTVHVHAESGAHVVAVAKTPPNPAEIVSSTAFDKLIDALAARYDRVIVDTPPCQVASDTLLLARRMDAVLFVIHGAMTGIGTVHAAIKQLRNAQAPLLGHILNQVDARKSYGLEGSYYVYGNYGT